MSQQILSSLLGNEELGLIKDNNSNTNTTISGGTNIDNLSNSINNTRDIELCKYSYFKYLYANGNKREAFDKLKEFHLELKGYLNQFEQYQQQITANTAAVNMGNAPSVPLQIPPIFQMYNPRELQKRKTGKFI